MTFASGEVSLASATVLGVSTQESSAELVVSAQPGGVVLQGRSAAALSFVERLDAVVRSTDLGQVETVMGALKSARDQLSGEGGGGPMLVEFSPRAMALLKEHGAVPTDDGFFRSMVHDGNHIAGNLDWRQVAPGPELVQLQTMAIGLALQASLQELAEAVQRVEDKIDHLTDRVRSVQVGGVMATNRVLTEFVESADADHPISNTDWSSIDHLRTEITTSIDATRLLLRSPVARAEPGWSASSRAALAKRMLDDDFVETLGLLSVCELNLASWHRLRVDRVAQSEPEHLERTLARVESDLKLHRAEDQLLLDELVAFVDELSQSTGLEGLELWKRNELAENTETLREALEQFADRHVLDALDGAAGELPTLRESLTTVKDLTSSTAKRMRERMPKWKRGGGDEPALEAGDQPIGELPPADG